MTLFLAILAIIGVIFGGAWFLMERWADINRRTPVNVSNESVNKDSSDRIAEPSKCSISNIPEGTFNYGGSTTWAPIRKDVDPVLERICPKFILRDIQPAIQLPVGGTSSQFVTPYQEPLVEPSECPKQTQPIKCSSFSSW